MYNIILMNIVLLSIILLIVILLGVILLNVMASQSIAVVLDTQEFKLKSMQC
jgi:hypothetical protein